MTEVMPKDPFVEHQLVRPEAPPWLVRLGMDRCGHCKSGLHRSCKGAVRVPIAKRHPDGLLRCYCPDCVPQVRCLTCNNQFADDVDPVTWSCLDMDVCAGRVALRRRNDSVWQLIQQCKTTAANQRRADRADRIRIRTQTVNELPDREASRTPRPTSGYCECCGTPTKGGRFAPGHDARLKSRLRKASDAGDKAAYKQLVERGWA